MLENKYRYPKGPYSLGRVTVYQQVDKPKAYVHVMLIWPASLHL